MKKRSDKKEEDRTSKQNGNSLQRQGLDLTKWRVGSEHVFLWVPKLAIDVRVTRWLKPNLMSQVSGMHFLSWGILRVYSRFCRSYLPSVNG